MKSLLRKKALSTESPKQLDRTLTALDLTFLGIGAVIGTGIFVLTGIVAAKHSGPGIMLSFLIAAFTCACVAFCYAEFASSIPVLLTSQVQNIYNAVTHLDSFLTLSLSLSLICTSPSLPLSHYVFLFL